MKEILINWLKKQRRTPKVKSLPARRSKGEPEPSGGTIKAELFSVDQMERYGQRLARSHKLATRKTPYYLLKRLDDNERILAESCHQLSNGKKASMTPAGEWLLDNYYLIEEQIRVVRHHLPKTFGRGLPQLSAPHNCPRIYDVASEAIAHGDGRWDAESLTRYIAAYQKEANLTLGELWALPGMLRLALIENLRRVSVEVAQAQQERNLADSWVTKMLESAENDPANLIVVIADMARSNPPRTSAFVAELVRRLQGHGTMLALPLTWVEQRLAEVGLTSDELIHRFNQQLAVSQLSVSNSISGLRQLSEMDWAEFVETMSQVEQTLRQDPAGVYPLMHFTTRDNYRHVIEMLARHCPHNEVQVAQHVLNMARIAAEIPSSDPRCNHIGYYLIDDGRPELEQQLDVRLGRITRLRHALSQAPLLSWLGSLSLITTACCAELLRHAYSTGISWGLALLFFPMAIVISQFVLNLLSEVTTRSRTPQPLPRLDFSCGIPAEFRSLVVIPTLIDSKSDVDKLINALEVCYLGNAMKHLHFALLTDFNDAPQQQHADDAELLAYASQQMEALNGRYPCEGPSHFFLFHRNREWNEKQGVWMGLERKRGKLNALNDWLRNRGNAFCTQIGDGLEVLKNVKYVITLDSDTVLPRESAHQLIAAMAHPLNQPQYDARQQRVVEGYAILQPRMAEEIPSYGQGRYAALCSSTPGNDPYTLMASDIYQDLFGEGSFIGKGIYDVDVFSHSLKGTCPPNLVLSHDLLEGCYARSGLLSDVLLYEQYPSNYLVDVARRSRWIRGDWQLLNWLLPRVKTADGSRTANPLSTLSRWKLFDNLRRSLTAPSLLLLLFCGFVWLPNTRYWLAVFAIILLLPTLLALVQDIVHKPPRRPFLQHLLLALKGSLRRLSQVGLRLATLPHETLYSLKAIAVTLWRLLITQRNLQEWTSYDQSKARQQVTLKNFYRAMWINPVTGLVLLFFTLMHNPMALFITLPLAALWMLAPLLLCYLSHEPQRSKTAINDEQRRFLRHTSRQTWDFFNTFVNQQENWLPPDNYQEIPEPVVAHRTSPTNIGLSLLANLTAYDFGYLTLSEALRRIELTLNTLDRMEHYRGHLYNWYDTRTLEPLTPRYISSVDSGNLAGHLLTLSAGLPALAHQPVIDPQQILAGLGDSLQLLEQHWGDAAPKNLSKLRNHWERAHHSHPAALLAELNAMRNYSNGLQEPALNHDEETQRWAGALHQQLNELCAEWAQWCDWLSDGLSELEQAPSLHWLANPPGTLKLSPEQQSQLEAASALAQERLTQLYSLQQRLEKMAQMDFHFLYDESTHLLTVGFNCDQNRMDSSKYDLLASEIRLTNYVAIATNQVPQRSWFALGRLFTVIDREPALMSWSGSMFEYLMPQLVMPAYPDSLLVQMCRAAVERQIAWGKERGVPWGISESGYFGFDADQNYQYHAFGVPGLGLRRGLGDDMVVAPYATLMALIVDPHAACNNLVTLEQNGAKGRYGFYEALDYTTARLSRGQLYVIIRSYMAHHQGMSFLALSHLLLDAPMVARFADYPAFQSTRLLLQERVPDAVELYSTRRHFETHEGTITPASFAAREFNRVDSPIPEVQLLSNVNYHLMLTQAGGSYSRWQNLALTRWREDATCDNWGAFCYLRDPQTGEVWSNTWQPIGGAAKGYSAVFNDAGAEFQRQQGALSVKTQIVVSPEDDIELRRVTLINRGKQPRTIEVTSYAEVVLAPAGNDLAHPAFSNLFVQTELLTDQDAILCHRRPREPQEKCPWLLHMMTVQGRSSQTSFETDRAKFIGRGRTPANPQALYQNTPLSNSAGPVIDPIIAIRQRVVLEPNVPLTLDIFYGVCEDRVSSLAMLEKYRDRHLADRVFELAWSHSQVVLRQLNANEEDANLFNRLASAVVFPAQEMRAASNEIIQNRRGQSGLWGHSISGDLPIVLLTVTDGENIELVQQLIQAHNYWRLKGLQVDLVILNEDVGGYRQELQNQIMSLIAAGMESTQTDKPGGIFVRTSEHMSPDDHRLLLSVARIYLDDRRGGLTEQLNQRLQLPQILQQPLSPVTASSKLATVDNLPRNLHSPQLPAIDALQFYNGLGGFSEDGREYVIAMNESKITPAPWSNVIANPMFGSVISESGQAYTWYENAHEYRLTPWDNDPICDRSGEAFYLRDEENGHFWSPTPLPARGRGHYLTRHGFGYSVFDHRENGIDSQLTVLVAKEAPVKLFLLTLTNTSGRTRKLSATGYVEFILGDLRQKSAMHIVTQAATLESGCGILATNHYGSSGSERTAFFGVTGVHCSISGDRREFIGRNGSLTNPAVLKLRRLSGKVGAAMDPCGAVQSAISLIDGDQRSFVFALGLGQNADEAQALLQNYLREDSLQDELQQVAAHWDGILNKVQIGTPQPAVDLLANGWLLYQTLSCRIQARSGYYQSGGAFGFRDQLQDTLALIHAAPERLREQILLCASRQFVEGDVQHWWHPPQGNGVRTRCSDDYLWLPLAICHYLDATDDQSILDEQVGYLEARKLAPGEESSYEQPALSATQETLYQHGVRALKHGLTFGEHGLPLMGAGDWNDGMNMVGLEGRGESVWLGFFLFHILQRYGELAQRRNDADLATQCRQQAATLRDNLRDHAWDGEWYRRGYFDSGEPLGSHQSAECRIDAIAQSWSVLSGAGDQPRSLQAMQSLDKHLVDDQAGLIKLLTPPFDGNGPNPGYIRGYLPGVRENGGQYTHGAVWAVMAFAEMGNIERAWELMALINPINHSLDSTAAERYKVEPYVVTADIYAVAPHVGRGGWSWYTGSAGWMYRLILESLLGLKRHGDRLTVNTRLPADWPQVTVNYREGGSEYQLIVRQGQGDAQVTVDGEKQPEAVIMLLDDGKVHQVEVTLGQ
ncbi:cyclic beta 1-2 glucan synthetase [Serratia proteamaculans]|uniref:Cyclic beta 1-2 glucan synthetase n=1 Tax=Serratia proteamaculans TaxID=28151 RepID=A0A7U0RL30_SERPR|nr:glucoamylase family protein [Serratia proteamaculans]MBO1503984.1 cyclic beta 1-2 glucan synthetase [Serratia proteamaculans]MDW5510385.1 glucoamylase family protein [Serratia proteamaculans]QQX52114.1 cyclic beta 1-2 glucan synthetase [Serratia proteamaculans]